MFPEEIVKILQKYQSEVSEEISNINLAIDRIKDGLNSVNSVLIDEFSTFAKNTGTKNVDKEKELFDDSQALRNYISNINRIQYVYKPTSENDKILNNKLDIFDIIVLNNTIKCSYSGHKTKDMKINLPVLYEDGKVEYVSLLSSYCEDCKRYTILKNDFKNINGVILCQIIDETSISKQTDTDEFSIVQKESPLYKYGYNVNSQSNLSDKQRHIILSSVIEANILNRRQIIDHLTTLIERGSKIPNWKEATNKWKQDKYYVEKYKTENLPNVIFDKIILKYSSVKKL